MLKIIVYLFILVKRLKRKKEVNEYWEKIFEAERKQINIEIDKRAYEELIQKQMIICIDKVIKLNKKKVIPNRLFPI